MARKHLLSSLLGAELPAGNRPPEADASGQSVPMPGAGGPKGAIGAVSRSIEQLKAQSVAEIAPDLIEDSPIADRLPGSPESHAELVSSIREHGQQVPILVRPHPLRAGRFQIAYGRRRLRALAELGRPVRSIVKPLTDEQLVVAQGQENSARADLSFIERALFAASLEEGGFGRETIMAALNVDKTGLSRLISAASKVPRDIIEAIGAAPRAGRDRWVELAVRLEQPDAIERARRVAVERSFAAKGTDDRFAAVFGAVAPRRARAVRPSVLKAADGTRVAQVRQDGEGVTVEVDGRSPPGFGAYLVEALPEIYAAFKRREGA